MWSTLTIGLNCRLGSIATNVLRLGGRFNAANVLLPAPLGLEFNLKYFCAVAKKRKYATNIIIFTQNQN